MNDYLELPERLYYDNFGGNITAFIEAAYKIFKRDFVTSHPNVGGRGIILRCFRYISGICCWIQLPGTGHSIMGCLRLGRWHSLLEYNDIENIAAIFL